MISGGDYVTGHDPKNGQEIWREPRGIFRGLEGMGEALVNQLCDRGMLKNVADIYALTKDDLLKLERMGDKSAQNVLDEIELASRVCSGGLFLFTKDDVLEGITKWMAVNSEGIYATRPWKIFGDGPVAKTPPGRGMNENSRKDMTAEDVRFTSKGKILYAFVMGVPDKEAVAPSLATNGPASPPKILNVELLGFKGKLRWTQDASALKVQLPVQKPCNHALTLKITSA